MKLIIGLVIHNAGGSCKIVNGYHESSGKIIGSSMEEEGMLYIMNCESVYEVEFSLHC